MPLLQDKQKSTCLSSGSQTAKARGEPSKAPIHEKASQEAELHDQRNFPEEMGKIIDNLSFLCVCEARRNQACSHRSTGIMILREG